MGEIKTADIRAMSVEQRLDLIERVWDTLVDRPGEIPIPDWHQAELERRLRELRENPEAGATLGEVEARILRRP
jgi:putative addiction module component (TIGR02574 family)